NLYILKILLAFPSLSCLNITGAPNLTLISNEIISNNGLNTINKIKEQTTSSILLIYLLYKFIFYILFIKLITFCISSSVIFVSEGKQTPLSNNSADTVPPM